MQYKQYKDYKDSGVEWLGSVPTCWFLPKISYAFKTIGSGTTPSTVNEMYYNGDIPWVTTGELREGIILETQKMLTKQALKENTTLKIFKKNSIIIAMYGATIGRVAKLGVNATTNQACCVISDSSIITNDYLYYWFIGFRKDIVNLGYGGGQPNISQATISHLKISIPKTILEQKEIVDYLDEKTAHIDNLIEKQTQLIELLKEKRQATISYVITKGLNPNTPMKDSGVEWLGDIPEHWKIKRTKFLFTILKRISGVDGYNVLSITQRGIVIKDTESGSGQLSMDYSKYQLAYKGDFAMNHMDLLTGYVDISKYDGVVSPDYRVFRLEDKKCFPDYYLYLYQNGYKNKIFFRYGQGSSQLGRWRLPSEQFNNFIFPYPPLEEQKEIAKYLDEKTTQIDTLIEKANKSIELLKEKRTALISAAVTGKIDVRKEA